ANPALAVDPDVPLDEHAEDGGVTGQNPELTVDGAGADLVRLALPDLAVRGDEFDLKLAHEFLREVVWMKSTGNKNDVRRRSRECVAGSRGTSEPRTPVEEPDRCDYRFFWIS